MINISKSGNAIKFAFTDSDHYLYGNGEIEVPVNSLSLIVDESNMVTFRKANSNDIFLSFDPANSNLSDKEGVINFYKTNMVGSTGGEESGITSGDVQTMIDNSLEDYYTDDEVDAALSGKADASNVYTIAETNYLLNDLSQRKADISAVTAVNNALTAHTTDTGIHVSQVEKDAWNAKLDASAYTPVDLSEYYTKGQTDGLLDEKLDASAYTPTDLSNYYTKQETNGVVDGAVSGKADTSAVTAVENDVLTLQDALAGKANTAALTAHTSDTDIHVTQADKTSWNAKAEPYSAGTGIEISGNVISATGGGGATYSAGTNISIDTANTINCTIPLIVTGTSSIKQASNSSISTPSNLCAVFGRRNNISMSNLNYIFMAGNNNTASNDNEAVFGVSNKDNKSTSTFGNSGNTLFAVGNGSGDFNSHSALEIRQNGDLYFADTDNTTYAQYYQKPMVRLQDMYGELGNKLETSAITSAITSASTNAEVAGAKAVYDAIQAAGGGGGGSVTVDSYLDNQSTNPVENQVISQAFEGMNTFIDTKADQSELYYLLGGSTDEYNPVTPIRLMRISQSDYNDLADGDGYDPDVLYIITPDEE